MLQAKWRQGQSGDVIGKVEARAKWRCYRQIGGKGKVDMLQAKWRQGQSGDVIGK